MGITEIDTGAGLTGGPITDTGTIGLQIIGGVAGTWSNPSSITVNAYGQIIAITSGRRIPRRRKSRYRRHGHHRRAV